MSPEVADTGSKVMEQREETSSPCAHPPFHGLETSSAAHRAFEDTAITPDEMHRTNPVDTVDAAAADLLKNVVEDEPGEARPVAEVKVWIIALYL